MAYDRFTSRAQAAVRATVQRGMLKPLVWSLVDVRVDGLQHFDGLAPAFVAVANHSSHLDAPLVFGALPRGRARYLAAGAAADYFFEVPWRKALTTLIFNAFAVERNAEGKRASESLQLLERGVPVLLFPEGGRARAGEFRPFKPGAAALAIAAGAPVVPIALVAAHEAMPRGTSWPRRGRPTVHVLVGAPIHAAEGERARELADRVEAQVRALHESIAPVPQRRLPMRGER